MSPALQQRVTGIMGAGLEAWFVALPSGVINRGCYKELTVFSFTLYTRAGLAAPSAPLCDLASITICLRLFHVDLFKKM